jgi:hypothetical protein
MPSKAEQKTSAALRAKQALEHAWERIDYRHEVIKPALEQVKDIEKTGHVELTEGDLLALLTTGQFAIEEGEGSAGI